MQEVADSLGCSLHKVAYWMAKHRIAPRSRSAATYLKHNPNGDPFHIRFPRSREDAKLLGLGLGLYWGEGNKANTSSIRLGNTDPALLKTFMHFLEKILGARRDRLRFYLQIFTDINPEEALRYWMRTLRIRRTQIGQPIITKSGSIGTYRKKSQYGVLTVCFHNKKLRGLLEHMMPT